MAEQDPGEVIVWKFEGPKLNVLVATGGTNKETDYINKYWMALLASTEFHLTNMTKRSNKTILCKLAQKSEYFGFLPDLGWDIKPVLTFYSFHWLQGHKKSI